MNWKPVVKAIIAVAGAILVAAQVAITDEVITSEEWLTIAIAGVTAFGVWFFPNNDPEPDGFEVPVDGGVRVVHGNNTIKDNSFGPRP